MSWPPRPGAPVDPQVWAFLDAIADEPRDAGVRLVFADWLEEHGDPRADLLRLQAGYIRAGNYDPDISDRTQAWMKAHGDVWLGGWFPSQHILLWMDFLEVKGYGSSHLLSGEQQEGLRQALRDGWVRHFRMTDWNHEQYTQAAGLGLLDGPASQAWISGSFSDETLSLLAERRQLRALDIAGVGEKVSVTDAGLRHLAGLDRLCELDLILKGLDGSGLAHLAGLTGLRELNLEENAGLTGAGLAHLAALTELRNVDLSQCPGITGAGLAHLAALTELRNVDLSQCPGITDDGLAHLSGLRHLEVLDLTCCAKITGAGVAHLHGLKALKRLAIRDAKLKSQETRALRKALPGCEVVRD